MPNNNLDKAFEECGEQLDRIIAAYRREKPKDPSKTIVEYMDGSISSFNIEGELGENSIPDKTSAVKVEIGNKVTSIELGAFSGCSGLTSITIPNSVTSIGGSAFEGCSELTEVTIPDNVMSIGGYAFYNCSGLMSVTIPNSVTSIESLAFYNTSIMNTYMTTKSSVEVQAMDYYPWGLPAGGIIHCSDIDFVVTDSGGSGS